MRRTRRGAASLGGGGFAKRGGGVQRGGKAPSKEEIKESLTDFFDNKKYRVYNVYQEKDRNIKDKINDAFHPWTRTKQASFKYTLDNMRDELFKVFEEVSKKQTDQVFKGTKDGIESRSKLDVMNIKAIQNFNEDKNIYEDYKRYEPHYHITKLILDNDVLLLDKRREDDNRWEKNLKYFVFNVDKESLKKAILGLLKELKLDKKRPFETDKKDDKKPGKKAHCIASKDKGLRGLVWCAYDKDDDELTRELGQNETKIKAHDVISKQNQDLMQKNLELRENTKEAIDLVKTLKNENHSLQQRRAQEPSQDEPSLDEIDKILQETTQTLSKDGVYPAREDSPPVPLPGEFDDMHALTPRRNRPRREEQPPPGDVDDIGVPDADFFKRRHALTPRRNR